MRVSEVSERGARGKWTKRFGVYVDGKLEQGGKLHINFVPL